MFMYDCINAGIDLILFWFVCDAGKPMISLVCFVGGGTPTPSIERGGN